VLRVRAANMSSRWRSGVLRRAGVGLAVLLAAAGVPLAGAPSASAGEYCDINVAPSRIRCINHVFHRAAWSRLAEPFQRADFTGSKFISSDLTESSLEGAILDGVEFRNTKLGAVDMTDASLEHTRFFGTSRRPTDLRGVRITGTQLVPHPQGQLRGSTGLTVTGKVTSAMLERYTDQLPDTEYQGCFSWDNGTRKEISEWVPSPDEYELTCRVVGKSTITNIMGYGRVMLRVEAPGGPAV
jgi:hypothetical protein